MLFAIAPDIPEPAPAPVIPAPEQQPDNGTEYILGAAGSYYAESINSVYIADQVGNQIIHADVEARKDLNYFELDAQPSHVLYQRNSDSLYVAFTLARKIVKIDLFTGVQTEILINSYAHSMVVKGQHVYFTVSNNSALSTFALYSVGLDGVPDFHGVIKALNWY